MSKEYKPVVVDGKLFGKEINPYEKPELRDYVFEDHPELVGNPKEYRQEDYEKDYDEWQQAEQNLKTFEVCENQFIVMDNVEYFGFFLYNLIKNDTFTADLNDKNQLINLKIV